MHRLRTIALVPLMIAAASAPIFAQGPPDRIYGMPYGWEWGWGHMLFGGLMMLLFWGGLIFLIVLAVRWLGSGGAATMAGHKTPRQILEERFARGEIDKEEFEARKRTLGV